MQEKFLNQERVKELWAAIKAALAGKADLSALADYITKNQLDEAIQEAIQEGLASAAGITLQVLDALPETGEEKVLYLVPSETEGTMDQYLWTDGAFKKVGSTSVDLEQYWSKDELSAMTADELAAILV